MLAAAQILPSLNLEANYDGHQGNLQQSNGNVLSGVNRAPSMSAPGPTIAAGFP